MTATTLTQWREIAIASLGLPDEKLLSVLALVESVPYCGQVGEVLDHIRPRLAVLRPPRPLTARRLLFRPAEDLFDDGAGTEPAPGRLSRRIIEPCWRILMARDADAVRALEDDLDAADQADSQDILELGLPFWACAADILTDFLGGEASIGVHRLDGGSVMLTRDILRQLTEFAGLLDVAEEIEGAKLRLRERPVTALSEWDSAVLRKTMAELSGTSMIRVGAFASAMMARMACPGEVLAILSDLSARLSEVQHADLVKRVSRDALAALKGDVGRLREVDAAAITDPAREALSAEQMVGRLLSLERHVDGLARHTARADVETARREIGTFVLDKVVVAADQAMAEKLDALAADGMSDDDTFEHEKRLDDCALSLRRCAGIANAVGIKRELDARLKTICAQLETYGAGITGDGGNRRARLILLVRLIELIAGPDEAQRVLFSHFDGLDAAVGL